MMPIPGRVVTRDAAQHRIQVLEAGQNAVVYEDSLLLDGSFQLQGLKQGYYELRVLGPDGKLRHRQDLHTAAANRLEIRLEDKPQGGISLQRLMHKPDKKAHGLLKKAQKAHGKKQWDRAIQFLKQAGELDAEYFDVWANLGALHLQLRRYEEAGPFLERAYAIDPQDGPNLVNLGGYWATRGDFPKAQQYLRQGLKAEPGSIVGQQLLAMVEKQLTGS